MSKSDQPKSQNGDIKPMNIADFDLGSANSAGGQTGSQRVKDKEDMFHQLKKSILNQKFTRQAKASWADRENFGEVMASHVAIGVFKNADGFEAAPKVSFVYDKDKKEILIASKYLTGDKESKVQTLDAFITSTHPEIKAKKHVKFVNEPEGKAAGGGEYNIGGPSNALLRKDLARGIAASMVIGDHDVNPGNFVVVKKNGQDRVARIDFGHAFNDLLNAPALFGGQVQNKSNQVLDFMNRQEVAGSKLGSPSKLWRDYPGMIPSQEMADALKELSESKIQTEIDRGKSALKGLYTELKTHNDQKNIKLFEKSLNAIRYNIGEKKKISIKDAKDIDEAYKGIETFFKEKQENMKEAAQLMQLQVNIDKIILNKEANIDSLKEQMADIKKTYNQRKDKSQLELQSRNAGENWQLEWIKTNAKDPAYKGSLEGYIKQRCKQLGVDDKALVQAVNNQQSLTSRQTVTTVNNQQSPTIRQTVTTVIKEFGKKSQTQSSQRSITSEHTTGTQHQQLVNKGR